MLPRGVTEKNHEAIRDAFLMLLLKEGIEVCGRWEDWRLEATGASRSQIWGSERTSAFDRTLEWFLVYDGSDKEAKELSGLYGGRTKPEDILRAPTWLKRVDTREFGYTYFIGFEWERDEEVGESFTLPVRAKSEIVYVCEKCGKEFIKGRRFKYGNYHVKDGGKLILKEARKVKR